MGGFLQSLLNGYFGIRVYHDRFEFNPTPIPYATGYSIKNMKYLGRVFHASIGNQAFNLTLVKKADSFSNCRLNNYLSGASVSLTSSSSLSFGKYSITCDNVISASNYMKPSNIVLSAFVMFLAIFNFLE